MSADRNLDRLTAARETAQKQTKARERLVRLFDEGSFCELDAFAAVGGQGAGVITGYGAVDGMPVFAFSQDISAESGAVGRLHAAKVKKVYDLAAKMGAPVVGIYDSCGARLVEGNDALAAYGDMMAAANQLSGVVPQISVVAGTCAGSAAMMACSADFVVMSEEAAFYMAAPGKDEKAGSAENAQKMGVAHIVTADDAAAVDAARRLLGMLPQNNLAAAAVFDFSAADGQEALRGFAASPAETDADQIVRLVADADSVLELLPGFAPSVFACLATVGGQSVGMIATRHGHRLCASCCAKIARLVSVCDAFHLPVVTFVDTPGFYANSETELAGSIREAAKLAHVYAEATTPKVSIVTGEAFGPAYIALAGTGANADSVFAWPSAVISGLQPQTAVAILHEDEITAEHSRQQVEQDYRENEASPFAAAADGYIEDVIDPASTRDKLITALDMLDGKRVTTLPKKHSNMPM